MYGQPSGFTPAGGGWMPAEQSPASSLDPSFYTLNPNVYLQNPIFPFLQNPGFPLPQNPSFPLLQNPSLPFLQRPNLDLRSPNFPIQNPNLLPQQSPSTGVQPKPRSQNRKEGLERIDRAVAKARCDLIAAGESVSAWKVSQAVVSTLQVDSWSSLGFQMQEVPSLYRLMVTEGKINAFVHCFVGVRRITSLYDLELAICKNECVEKFEELELGPFVRHPLVVHYFSVNSKMAGVYKISSEEVISCLCEFMDTCKNKHIKAEEFLDFISKKRLVTGREKLGVRIHNLGMLVTSIREARKLEDSSVKKVVVSFKQKSDKGRRKRPLFSTQKKKLDERFSAISQRIKSFPSVHVESGGKHIRFVSSSSEDGDSDDHKSVDDNRVHSQCKFSLQSIKSCDQVSSCPYPSAIEEMTRLGLKGGTDGHSSPASSVGYNDSNKPVRKKRKSENLSCGISAPTKLPKRDTVNLDVLSMNDGNETKELSDLNETDLSLGNNIMEMFITTWKEACRGQTVDEVFERMLQFYNKTARQRKRMKSMFSSYPCIGLLNVAVTAIKCGMWDSIYDTFHAVSQDGLSNKISDTNSKYESIDVEPSEKNTLVIDDRIPKHIHSVTVEDIIRKITTYFELDHVILSNGKSPLEKKLIFLRKLCKCEVWLMEHFSVEEFKSFGYGEFLMFLEDNASLLPNELLKCLIGDICEKSAFEVCMLRHQLVVLLSQALNSLWENRTITKQEISLLLMRQFPLISFDVIENGSTADFLDIVREQNDSRISKCVLFSVALFGTCYNGDFSAHTDKVLPEIAGVKSDIGERVGTLGPVTSKDAVEVLLRAPMLSDLNSWSHWDLIFAPSLGPLVGWLLNEVNTKDFLCLVTKDGKVVRINPLATLDSFLEASLQLLPFQTALELISLFSLFGGKRHVPLSLLKCHARRAFEVILKTSMENMEVNDSKNFLMQQESMCKKQLLDEDAASNLGIGLNKHVRKMNNALSVASRFILHCLGYLPSEFRTFAADVLLSGLQYVVKGAPSAILCKCNQTEQRIMLHEVGLSLGIVEWIDDYHEFCSTAVTDLLNSSGSSHLKTSSFEICASSKYVQDAVDKLPSSEGEMGISVEADGDNEERSEVSHSIVCLEVSGNGFENSCMQHVSQLNAALVIESIRQEEFGLDPSLSNAESYMLKKQHARLGRALNCLSQELYSQDSHFLLELVQNADDNIYPEHVEPTLTFILRESGIIVLNNERGFSAQNIRALCDVGNSTKKGSSTGYIGHKGIGFKSVFRVTDAPEIHSNGFHVKFDISEGQIGFILPTIVPACDIDLFSRLASGDSDQVDANFWNTCIVLPFRSKLAVGSVMNNIMSMFSDLHPSLLLFLHRLQCIKFRNMLNNSIIVMRKEILGNGIITVSHGKEKMTWLVVSHKLQSDVIRPDVQTTEIAIAFTLQESDSGNYNPRLDLQPVFAFLPLRTYGLKFILQGDFVLPSSREEVDGDSPWNQWLLSEFPGLFVSAERSFCALPCFTENPGKGVAAYMSFVPLVGEVHGFFSSLPRMIISKLRMSNCLLVEGDTNTWVPPCKVLRSWNERARILLPDSLLLEHLGLGFLDKDIVFSDPLARALGIEEYGPKILFQMISSLCCTENSLKSVGLGWLFSCLNELYMMSFHSSGQSYLNPGMESDLINNLRKIQFIPLSDGTYSSVDEGTIWLHSDALSTGFDDEHGLEVFPNLYAKLRTVSPALLSSAAVNISCSDRTLIDNVTRMLHRIGVQQLSAHEIIKVHILPAISDDRIKKRDKNLMSEYLSFVMFHLQSSCPNCRVEREYIISELRNKALILTSYGYKRLVDVSIHFSKEYGNPIDVNKLIDEIDLRWYEVDITYLKHPITKSSCRLMKWREFFQELGITDFVQIVQVEKSVTDISHTLLKNVMWDRELISLGSTVKDWESHELVHLLSLLSMNGNREKCKYLLEVLDTLWDDCFSGKVAGYYNFKSSRDNKPFKSSFISSICDVRWTVSSMDDELHYPKDLFYDCDSVRSVLGASAPYAVPKLRSEKLLRDIGFKTQVTLDDIFAVLQLWRRLETPLRASIAQMSRFYSLIWNEMATSKRKIVEEFHSGPFIFVPYASGSKHEDLIPGRLLSPEEVYWNDPTGSMDQMKAINPQCDSIVGTHGLLSTTLCNVYPGLHDFFVMECGVHEIPPFRNYLRILLQLSTVALPSQAANAVFQVFLKWTDGLKSGVVTSEDIVYLKECLLKLEFTVLPTVQDKWVSLHPSFGVVCWCDDEKLRKEFKHSDNIEFLYFGEHSNVEKEMLRGNVAVLMQTLGIPALSEVVTREAIYHGPGDCSFKASLVDWALPYAQRYVYNIHPDKYFQLKQTRFENLNNLRIVVVDKLFYRNVVKRCDTASTKRFECNSLLQGNILYTTKESDSHSVFMELSHLLFDGTPELHLANFIHMITTMVESGSTEEQLEFFILNSQKMPKLPNGESVWSLSSVLSIAENDEMLQTSASTMVNVQDPSKSERKPGIHSSWPPVDWKTAPDFSFARANGFRTQAAVPHPGSSSRKKQEKSSEVIIKGTDTMVPIEMDADWTFEDVSAATTTALIPPDSETLEDQYDYAGNQAVLSANLVFDPIDFNSVSEGPELGSGKFGWRTKLNVNTPNVTQAMLTGRIGELAATKYFAGKVGGTVVKWVNENKETGLPYDIVIREEEESREYIEVKTTRSVRKDWFIISTREWQFAIEKGESFSIAHVVLLGNNTARIAMFKNPVRLCQMGKLQLVVMMPNQRKEFPFVY